MTGSWPIVAPDQPRPVVLVTGAGRRLGRRIAVVLARGGYDVGVHYRTAVDGARETVAACLGAGARSALVRGDLRDADTADALVQGVMAELGHLDALVNSAAVLQRTPLDTVTAEEWDDIFAVNLRAPFLLSLAAARAMGEAGGAIVNITDHLASEPEAALVPHGVSKAALEAMTRHLALHLAPRVRVNAVSPGAVLPADDWPEEAQRRFAAATPLQRLGTPDDAADAVLYLLRAPFVTGHTIVVDGGRHLQRH